MKILSWIESQTEARWFLTLTVVALILRLGWVGLMAERQPRFDEEEYIRHAVGLSQGEGYVDEAKNRVAFWPVGYPLIVAGVYRLTGPGRGVTVGLQVSLGILTCLLLYVLGKRTFGILIARVTSLLLAVYPNQVFFSTLHLTEPLFTILLLAAFTLLLSSVKTWSWKYVVPIGMLLGLAALTRPPILLFPLLLPFWFVRQGWRWPSAVSTTFVVFGTLLATISPWLIRNHQLTGRWTDISTSGGQVFWVGNHPRALGGSEYPRGLSSALRDGTRYDWHRGYRLGWESIRDAPGKALLRSFSKVSYFFALETDGVLWNLKGFERAPPLVWTLVLLFVANAAYVVVLGTGLLGLLSLPGPSPVKTFFMLLLGFQVVIVILFIGDPRYHYPFIPFMLLFCCKGVLHDWRPLITKLRQRDSLARRRMLVWTTVMSLLLLMMAGNLWLKYLESQRY